MVVTASMVAKHAGVSQAVVSKVLHSTGGNIRVSELTTARVRAAATELGYRPNAAARAMKRGRFNAIGLLFACRYAEAAVSPLAMWSIQQQMMKRGLHLTMAPVEDDKLRTDGVVPQVLKEWSVDGLLVSYTYNTPEPLLRMIREHRTPAIWLNRKLDSNCVYLDDYRAGGMATECVLSAGHRRVAYLGFRATESHYSAQDRRAGYEQAMRSAGLSPHDQSMEGLQAGEELAGVVAMLRSADRPSAIVTYSDHEASVVLVAAARAGLRIPEDLSLVAIANASTPICGVEATAVEVRHGPMGETAVELLSRLILNPTEPLDPVAIAPRMIEGRTVASAR